jgi:hypothetical protein
LLRQLLGNFGEITFPPTGGEGEFGGVEAGFKLAREPLTLFSVLTINAQVLLFHEDT